MTVFVRHRIGQPVQIVSFPRRVLLPFAIAVFMAGTVSFLSAQEPVTGLSSERLKVSIIQYLVEGNQSIDSINKKVESFVRQAAADQADCAVLPELLTLDAWRVRLDEQSVEAPLDDAAEIRRIATEVTPGYLAQIARLAVNFQIDICAGSTPRMDGDTVFNSACFFSSDGHFVCQDKLYPTAWEQSVGIESGRDLKVIEADWGRFVILTCYDVEFPDVSNALVSSGPDLIFVPSMTESSAGLSRVEACARARAVEHHAFVIVCGASGSPAEDWKMFGQAELFAPQDESSILLAQVKQQEMPGLFSVSLDISQLRQSRQTTKFYPARTIGEQNGRKKINVHSQSLALPIGDRVEPGCILPPNSGGK